MKEESAVEWHSKIAKNFDSKYQNKSNFIERNKIWSHYIDKHSHKNYNAFDVGCGSGIFSCYLAERNNHVLAIDGSTHMLDICKSKIKEYGLTNIEILKCDINTLNIQSDIKPDLIICSSVVEYLNNIELAFESLSSLLNKNGVLILSIPNKSSIYRKIEYIFYKLTGHPKYFKYVKNTSTLSAMHKLLKNSNLTLIEHKYFSETPYLSKLFRKLGLAKYSDNLLLITLQKL